MLLAVVLLILNILLCSHLAGLYKTIQMDTCFICTKTMVPEVPAACKNASLQRAFETLQFTRAKHQPPRVAHFDVQLSKKKKYAC
jgi:hypothetical protein